MQEAEFFEHYCAVKADATSDTRYCTEFQRVCKELGQKVPELPFSNPWLAQNTVKRLPAGCELHLGILNSLRSWSLFEIDPEKKIEIHSNTGGFGIDGMVSTLLGSSLASPDKLFIGVIGDLAFFYDMNALGNRHVGNNIRLMVVNNGRGTEFRNYNHPAARFGESADAYMAAYGHYGKKSHDLMRHYTLKKICFSGSVMPASCLSVWQQNLPDAKFVNQYGPTEATASCTYYEVDHLVSQDEQLPIGRPYNNYRVFLLNEDLTETPNGEIGEICVSGPILALGYYNDPERTEKSFIINPNYKGYPERMYRTGDYGRIREDGLLEFHGRMDRQVKHMGHRVELDEIEYAANQIAGVDECVSLYNKEKEVLYLFYSGEIAMRQVVLELRKVLPGFMVPRKVKQVSALPKLASGKIDMTTLKEEM